MAKEKLSLKEAMKQLKKKFGETSVFKGSDIVQEEVEPISTGSLALDAALLCGGFPKGRLIEISGVESSGKTFLCLMAIKKAQQAGLTCAFIDAEHTLDKPWCDKLGISYEDLIISRPDFTEDALTTMMILAKTGEVPLIVWDSVPALPTKEESDKEMGDRTVGGHARILTKAMRQLTPICSNTNTTILFINQIRDKIGVRYGNPETTPGGRALKHHCSVRVRMSKVASSLILDNLKRVVGHRIRARVQKNKTSTAQGVVVEFTIRYEEGIDTLDEIETVGIQCGVITRPNRLIYQINDEKLKGKDALHDYLSNNPEIVKQLEKEVMEAMRQGIGVTPKEESDKEESDNEESGDDQKFLDMTE